MWEAYLHAYVPKKEPGERAKWAVGGGGETGWSHAWSGRNAWSGPLCHFFLKHMITPDKKDLEAKFWGWEVVCPL